MYNHIILLTQRKTNYSFSKSQSLPETCEEISEDGKVKSGEY